MIRSPLDASQNHQSSPAMPGVKKRPVSSLLKALEETVAGEDTMAVAESVLKRPALADKWHTFADTSDLTPQQRHVWKKSYASLPEEIRTSYQEIRSSNQTGACKAANRLVNSIVPKNIGYGDTLHIDSMSLQRFLTCAPTKSHIAECTGYALTQMISPSALGSQSALDE